MAYSNRHMHYRGGERVVTMKERCRRLRREATRSERILWGYLQDRRMCGLKFRQQHQFGPFILDFFCPEIRLAVELDGSAHDTPEATARDRNRDTYLHGALVEVLHIRSERLTVDLAKVVDEIRRACRARMAPGPPDAPPLCDRMC